MILGFMSGLYRAFVAAVWGLHLGVILRASLVVSGASRRRLRGVFGSVLGGYADMFGEMWACFGGSNLVFRRVRAHSAGLRGAHSQRIHAAPEKFSPKSAQERP